MADLILELFSEEIPARMQAKAESDLGTALEKALGEAGLSWKTLETASGPRRLTVFVDGLSERSADVKEERKGPKVGAPDKAVEGFLRGAGLNDIGEAEVRSDPKKGDFYVAVIETPGRSAADIIAEAVPAIIRGFHWPKSMRWGDGELRWVRPLQRIVCVLDGAVVPFEVDGIASGNETEGHRVHGRGPYTVTSRKDYEAQLTGDGHVKLTREARRQVILDGIDKVCTKAGLDWIEDRGLLEEVTGLAEWPVVVLGDMDPDFLTLPPEVIQLSMRTHQKYFAVNDKKTGQLAPHFIVVANIEAADGGRKIAEGNARVLSARLEDARFFWEKDKATPLEEMAKKLSTIAFKQELGSLGDKVNRVAALARELAPKVGADPDLAERAARLAKADLVSEMVGEFPELQGVMGRYYALETLKPSPPTPGGAGPSSPASGRGGESGAEANPSPSGRGGTHREAMGGEGLLAGLSETDVRAMADAIRDHYKPQGPSDSVPTDPVGIAVALADKLDTLVGFWAIDEKPTGSKDPFALRRAALGVVRIVLESEHPLSMLKEFVAAALGHRNIYAAKDLQRVVNETVDAEFDLASEDELAAMALSLDASKLLGSEDRVKRIAKLIARDAGDLLSFFADRLKQYLRDQGQRHDLIDAVFALGEDDLVLITRRVEALGTFLDTEDGSNLLAGYKRAANILRAEEKKGDLPESLSVDAALIGRGPAEEQALAKALGEVQAAIEAPLEAEDFTGAMAELARLRAPVDAFFDAVMVNDDDPAVRANRLALLTQIRDTLHRVADFSRIDG